MNIMGILNKKNIIRNITLVVGIIFVVLSTILLLNDLELGIITQWTVISAYFMIIFMVIGIILKITQK